MSIEPLKCGSCGVDGVLDRAGKFPEDGNEATYAVGWRCGRCGKLSVEVCPAGPVEPTPSSCLNCGAELPDGGACTACGMPPSEAARFLRVDDRSPSLSVAQATTAFESGLFRHGFAVLDALLQREQGLREAWHEKASAYQGLHLNEAAVRCYRRALSLRPDALVEIALACALADLGRQEEAVAVYDALTSSASTDAPALAIAHANRGNSHEALGQVDAAISDYEEAVRREPHRVTHYTNYARLFWRRKRWAEAHDVIVRGLAVVAGEGRLPLLLEKARTANEQAKAEVGLSAADAALSLAPDSGRALYQRAWSLGMLGRLEEAQVALRRLVELEPNNEDAQRALGKIESAMPPGGKSSRPWWKLWS